MTDHDATPENPAVSEADELLTLADAAEQLGVHYMTAYRYVRTGRLNATKERGQWWVRPEELAIIAVGGRGAAEGQTASSAAPAAPGAARLAVMLRRRAVVGDDAGAWSVIVEAMASGMAPDRIHTQVLGPALVEIGQMWADGQISIVDEHQATAVVQRILGRMTPLFRHPGRRRCSAVVGMVPGDFHSVPTAMLSDLLSNARFNVIDLGANVPAEAFIDAVRRVDGPVVLGICALVDSLAPTMVTTVKAVRAELPELPIIVGGPVGTAVGPTLDCAGYARTAEDALTLFEACAPVKV